MTTMLSLLLATLLTLVEFNVENLFDTQHDSLKQDMAFTPKGDYRWTTARYRTKIDNLSAAIIAAGDEGAGKLPDLIAMVEVENDSVMTDLTRHSELRNAGYEYIMTNSRDARGIDVALVYKPAAFAPIATRSLQVDSFPGRGYTRDVLYVSGRTISDDTLHIFIVHAPSRRGGAEATQPYRLAVAEVVEVAIDSLRDVQQNANIIVTGDLNAYASDASLQAYEVLGLTNSTATAVGRNGAEATYRYSGVWKSLDHVLVSEGLAAKVTNATVVDNPFLLEEDERYGGVKPRRMYNGRKYNATGTSDHLPLRVTFNLTE